MGTKRGREREHDGRVTRSSGSRWQTVKRLSLCLFFPAWWILRWTHDEELCLKWVFEGREVPSSRPHTSSPYVVARLEIPARWHIDRRPLACLPWIPCSPLSHPCSLWPRRNPFYCHLEGSCHATQGLTWLVFFSGTEWLNQRLKHQPMM